MCVTLAMKKPLWLILLFLIAFILLVLASVLPFVFQEKIFIKNNYFGGKAYGELETSDSSILNFKKYYPDFVRTFEFGIFFFCVVTEINEYDYHYNVNSLGVGTIQLGKECNLYPWHTKDIDHKYKNFDGYTYSTSMVNGSVTILDVEVSAPGGGPVSTPGSIPGYMGGAVYDCDGESVFLKNVNFDTFNALRVFVIIALIIAFIILVKLIILVIVKHLHKHHHHQYDHKKKHKKLIKIILLGLLILLIVWIIILILILVIHFDIIHYLFDQKKALVIFVLGVATWLFWIGFIFALIVFIILHLKKKCKKKMKTYPPHYPSHETAMTTLAQPQASGPQVVGGNSFV